jgi:uncharacterized repeat protein (TIGR01451 family)
MNRFNIKSFYSILPRALRVLAACAALLLIPPAFAQSAIPYSNTTGGAIADNNCAAAARVTRVFNVPIGYIVADVNLGVLITHTYRSDLRIDLTSPAGTTVTIMTWTGNVQAGDNVNDLFDDEALGALTAHVTGANDPLTPTPPPYSHSFRPSSPLSAFDGQNAAGDWTMTVCDAVAADTGTFNHADLFITPAPAAITTTKISGAISDGISAANPKFIPGAIISYCITISNAGPSHAVNINAADVIPAALTYIPGSMLSGENCGVTATTEDDDNTGADENDPVGTSINATTISIASPILAASGSFAIRYRATVN